MYFKDSSSLNKAFELNGSELDGFSLTVDKAKSRDSQGSGGRSGGGRSGGGGRIGGRGGRFGGRDGGPSHISIFSNELDYTCMFTLTSSLAKLPTL